MKVALCAPLPPPTGGVSIWAAEYLQAAPSVGLDIDIVDISPGGGRVPTKSRLRLGRAAQTIGVVGAVHRASRDAQICHIASTWHWSLVRDALFCRVAKRHAAKVVLHVHASTRATASIRNSRRLSRWAVRRLLQPVDLVVTLSDELVGEMRLLLPKTPTVKLPNPVNTDLFRPGTPSTRTADPNTLRVLFVGRLSREKGFVELAEAVIAEPDVRLVTVGDWPRDADGDEANVITDLLRRLDATTRHEHFDSLGREQIAEQYRAADVFALPSHNEGLPMSLLEAMASGIPALITDVGGMADVRRSAGEPFSVCSVVGDSASVRRCLRLLSAPEVREQLGAAGRRLAVSSFSRSRVFAELAEEYQRLVDAR